MKTTAMFWLAATTMVLISLAIMAAMNFPINWIFCITVLGQIMLGYLVFRVLTDNYTTNKAFEDFYEDLTIQHYIS